MDFGTLINVAQTLFAALHSSELKEMWSMMGYKSELDELSRTVNTVRAVLLDAEAKQEDLSYEARLWVEELKEAVYDADDLLDEFVTLAKQKKLTEGGKVGKEVRLFFSRFNPLSVAYNMSQGVKKIRTKLDGIANNHSKFGLSLDYQPLPRDHNEIRKKRQETCSYVDCSDIIGRDKDVENIIGMLLDPHGQRDVSFLTIVGMGGLGKTALAQLVYNDENVAMEFPLRLWTCVSDQDQKQFDVKTILAQLLESATRQKHADSSLEVIISHLREKLAGKRFLIILDDVWTENRNEWHNLVRHLMGGKGGSWVVVTSRSKETAKVVGNNHVYDLQGLSDENSWRLFQMVAFERVQDQVNTNLYDNDLINIGQKIVKYCANVPLAIRVVGSLLYEHDKSKWLSIQESGLANLREGQSGIKPILKLSYRNLESPLKSCFSYCALFPKDFEIEKEMLISLWIAQGFVVPLEKGQTIEDAAEEYILILLRRCFFQDVQKNMFGEIEYFKLHDLMHDVALEVSEKEICGATSFTGNVDKTVRHISAMRGKYEEVSFTKAHIRTYLHFGSCRSDAVPIDIELLLSNYTRLRALDLSFLNLRTLPSSIGKLIHLKYLEVSNHDFESLPNSITKLYNLQTLDLSYCYKLKKLPENFCKLVNLRVLKLPYSNRLTSMPSGMGKLTSLYKLNKFVVGEGKSSLEQHADLEGLKALRNLRGLISIVIHFPKSGAFAKYDSVGDGAYMRDKKHLNGINFECKHEKNDLGPTVYEEQLLGALQPHANLKELELMGYRGVKMPTWAKGDNLATFLPNLVSLSLFRCPGLQYLPLLREMHLLKSLHVSELPNLEYIENDHDMAPLPVSNGERSSLLPCLNKIYLSELPKLKSWWRSSGNVTHQSPPSLLQLRKLEILDCPELTSIPCCPNVEKLDLCNFNGRLRIITNDGVCEEMGDVASSTSHPKLRKVYTDSLAWLHSTLPMESFQSLISLLIYRDQEVESLTEFERFFRACSTSLRILGLNNCPKLRCLSGGLSCLSHLENLYLSRLPITSLADKKIDGEDENDGMPWGILCNALQHLEVTKCEQLQSIPRWFQKLTSLRHLVISGCSRGLYERCQSSTGEDWLNIQHIPSLSISTLPL